MNSPRAAADWRPLARADLPALTDLARACLAADGGQPFAASPDFLANRYAGGAQTWAGWDGEALACASSLRPPPGDDFAVDALTTGLVHPAWRRRGLGGYAFDRAASLAGPGRLRAETEALNAGAHALYLSRGLSQVFAEDVMQLPGPARLPAVPAPAGSAVLEWGQADPARFYAVYVAAFTERPGFPGWPQERWVDWHTGDEDFRPELMLLATWRGADAAFVAGEASGWIAQVGVVPAARGKGIGAWLMTEVMRRIRSAGESAITLNVNVSNPRAAALYRRLGFVRTGGRARYQIAD